MDHVLYDLAFVFKFRWFPDGYTGGGILYALCDFAGNFYFPWVLRDIFWCTTVFLFVFICGISCSFSRSNLKRGLKLAAVAVLLTLFTYSVDTFLGQKDEFTIRFGILHMLAASILLYCLLRRLDYRIQIFIALAAIIKGLIFSFTPFETNVQLFALFINTTSAFQSADYFPLLPWFGYFLLGTVIGPRVYRQRRSFFAKFSVRHPLRPVTFTGRHSLFFYLFHQPIVYVILMGISFLAFRS